MLGRTRQSDGALRVVDVSSDPEPALYSKKLFCATHGIGPTKFHALVNGGQLIAVRALGRTMVRREDAKAWRDALPRLSRKT